MPRRNETSQERRARLQGEQNCLRSAAAIEGECEGMHAANSRMLDSARSSRRCTRTRRKAIVRHRQVLRDGRGQAILSIAVLFFLPAIVIVDLLLAGGTVDFLLLQSEDLKEWGNPVLLKFLTLMMIVIIELKIALAISHARDHSSRAVFWFAIAGLVIAGLMGFMSFVLTTAGVSNFGLEGAGAGLPWAVAGVTFVLHSLAIFSGDSVRIALGWLLFGMEYGTITVLRANFNLRAQNGRRAVGRMCRRYARHIERHNRAYPDSPVRFGPIEADLESVLETLFSPAELRRMRGAAADVFEEPTPATALPEEVVTQEASDDAAAHDVAEDYSALAAEEAAQHAEEEVTI